jgi:hypothetical protein
MEQIFLYAISGNSGNNVTEESQHMPANIAVNRVNENTLLHHTSSTSNSNNTFNMYKSLTLVCAECVSGQARYRTSKLYGSPSKIFTELSGTAKKNILSNVMKSIIDILQKNHCSLWDIVVHLFDKVAALLEDTLSQYVKQHKL